MKSPSNRGNRVAAAVAGGGSVEGPPKDKEVIDTFE